MEPGTDEPCPLDLIRDHIAEGKDISDDDWRMAEDECSDCFWSSDEYSELTSYSPLFRFALDFIQRRELGIEPKGLSTREEQAVLLVHSEIEGGRARRLKKGSTHGKQREGEDYGNLRR